MHAARRIACLGLLSLAGCQDAREPAPDRAAPPPSAASGPAAAPAPATPSAPQSAAPIPDEAPPKIRFLLAPRVGPSGDPPAVRLAVRVAVEDASGAASASARAGGVEAPLVKEAQSPAPGVEIWAGALRWPLAADKVELPVPFSLEVEATDRGGLRNLARRDGQVTFFPWATVIEADPGAYSVHALPDGSAIVAAGDGAVGLAADGGERWTWSAEGSLVAEAVPVAGGGAYLRVVSGGAAPAGEVLRVGADGKVAGRWKAEGQWPLAIAADERDGVWMLARTPEGPRLSRLADPVAVASGGEVPPVAAAVAGEARPAPAAGSPPERARALEVASTTPLEGAYDTLLAMPGGGVLVRGPGGVEAIDLHGQSRWKADARKVADAGVVGDAVAVLDGQGLRLFDAETGAARGEAFPATSVRFRADAMVASTGAEVVARGPDGTEQARARLPGGGVLSADGRLVWWRDRVRRVGGAEVTFEAPVRAALDLGDSWLVILAPPRGAPPIAALVDAAGKVRLREKLRPAVDARHVVELTDGFLVHGTHPQRPGGLLVRVRAVR